MRAGLMLAMAAVGAAVVAHHPPTADACTCSIPRGTFPRDGAIGVPRNTALVIHDVGVGEESVVVLRGSDGVEVPVETVTRELMHRIMIVRPQALLEPDTSYELAYGEWPDIVLPVATFTTGAAIDDEPPAFAGLFSFAAEAMQYRDSVINSCVGWYQGYFRRVWLEFTEAPDAAYYALEARHRAGLEPPTWQPLILTESWDVHFLQARSCGPRPPPLRPWEAYCLRIIAYDLAGNASGGDVELCAPVTVCEQAVDEDGEPLDECAPIPSPDQPELIDPPYRDQSGCMAGAAPRPGWLALLAVVSVACSRRRRLR